MTLNGKKVIDFEIDGVDRTDWPKFCDAYFTKAIWNHSEKELSDEELEQLTEENPDIINTMAVESCLT